MRAKGGGELGWDMTASRGGRSTGETPVAPMLAEVERFGCKRAVRVPVSHSIPLPLADMWLPPRGGGRRKSQQSTCLTRSRRRGYSTAASSDFGLLSEPRLRQRVKRVCRKGFSSLRDPEVALSNQAHEKASR
jgi:hypothetical protein